MKKKLKFFISLACFLLQIGLIKAESIQTASGNNYFVSPTGSDSNNGLSADKPFRSVQKASNLTLPGDTVFLMNGTFTTTNTGFLAINRSGTANAWIVYTALKGNKPKIKATGSVWETVLIAANYIVFDEIELEGNLQNLKLAEAEAAEAEAEAGGTNWTKYAIYNNGGITLGGNNSPGNHHIVIRNCTIHDFPGGGIQGIKSDYATVEDNQIYNVNWYTMYAGSGISLWHTFNSDMEPGYKNFVRRNRIHDSKTLVKWISCKCLSDGNGIIIDDNRQTQDGKLGGPYVGRTLVENNICFNNGGSGIHAYSSDHTDIINNTTFNNGLVVGYANIFQSDASDGKVMNNIMVSKNGGKVNSNSNTTNVTFDYNIYFNGNADVIGPHDKFADPMFVNLSTDPAVADFHLTNGSPAVDFGTSVFSAPTQAPAADFEGNIRPKGNGIDAGAYESTFHSNSNTGYIITPANGESFKEGSDISIAAIGKTTSGIVSKVEFYSAAVKIGESTSYPFQMIWKNPSAGSSVLSARIYDDQGNVSVTDGILVRISSSASIQKIVNGEFDNGTNGWLISAWNGAVSSFSIDNSLALSGTNSALIATTQKGVNDYEAQFRQAVSLIKGLDYSLSFSAKTSVNRPLNIWIQKGGSPYTTFYSKVVNLTNTAQNFGPFPFKATATDPDCFLEFLSGLELGNLWLDNISLTETDNSPKPVCSLSSPAVSSSFDNPASIEISAKATVTGSSISKVDFYADNELIGTDKSLPYNLSWTGYKNGDYLLTARATDANGNITTSAVIPVSISNITGMQTQKNNQVKLFPNPATDFFRIQNLNDLSDNQIYVYDLQGKLVANISNPDKYSENYDISKFKSGIYLIQIKAISERHYLKLIKL